MYIDIHTHSTERGDNVTCIINSNDITHAGLYSTGLHPWDIGEGWQNLFAQVEHNATHASVVAIGECGIDKLTKSNITLQKEVFEAHIHLAEKVKKPLIIHCVKAQEEIIALHRLTRPTQPWIIHGFRGKPQQAKQLIREDFYLSYGEFFNEESLAATPLNRLLIESDTSLLSIEDIYKKVAKALNLDIESLISIIENNTAECMLTGTRQDNFK